MLSINASSCMAILALGSFYRSGNLRNDHMDVIAQTALSSEASLTAFINKRRGLHLQRTITEFLCSSYLDGVPADPLASPVRSRRATWVAHNKPLSLKFEMHCV